MDNTTHNTSEEVWKSIKDSDYFVSNLGNVKNKHNKLLVQQINTAGYMSVVLFVNKLPVYCRVHRLVAEAFLEPTTIKLSVNHIDNDKLNNVSSNLEWMTLEENYKAAVRDGLMQHGEDRYNAVLTDETVVEILDLMREGFSDKDLAAHYGVVRSSMFKLRRGLSWQHIGREGIPIVDSKKKLNGEDISVIRNLFKTKSDTEIAKEYNVSSGTIHQIRIGATWKNY